MAEAKPAQHGYAELAQSFFEHGAYGDAMGIGAITEIANHHAANVVESSARQQRTEHAVDPISRFGDVFDEQDRACRQMQAPGGLTRKKQAQIATRQGATSDPRSDGAQALEAGLSAWSLERVSEWLVQEGFGVRMSRPLGAPFQTRLLIATRIE